jgi:sRNA-binding protein
MTDVGMSRRGALGALAAFTAAPAIALPAPADAANALWAERQSLVERLAQLSAEYSAAYEKLPAWAMAGPERIDADGNPCGDLSSWPLVEDLTPLAEPDAKDHDPKAHIVSAGAGR